MELRHLRYFTAVVEAKGYRSASRRLHIAQPALSQTVADLEDELGLKLFVRKGPQVQLTPAGEAFYQEAKKTLAQAEQAVTVAKRAEKGQTGTLRIGFIPFATQHFLPELLRSYKQQNPGLLEREESPSLFDSILSLCGDAGFSPRFDSHSHLAESMYTLVKAEEGVAILPAWARSFAMNGLQCANLLPDTVQVELVLLQKRDATSLALRSFVQLLETDLQRIQEKTAFWR